MSLIVFLRKLKFIALFGCCSLFFTQPLRGPVFPTTYDPNDPLAGSLASLNEATYGATTAVPGYPVQGGMYPQQMVMPNQMVMPGQVGMPVQMRTQGQVSYQNQASYPGQMMNPGMQRPIGYQQPINGMMPGQGMPMQGGFPQQMQNNPTMIGQNIGEMSPDRAHSVFTDVTNGTSALSTLDDFNTTLQGLEQAFNQCNFKQIAGDASGLSTATLISHAIAAIRKVVETLTISWDSVQRLLAKAVATNALKSTTQSNQDAQNRWMATAYMLAAAANNKTFISALIGHTMSNDAKYFWDQHVKIMSVQPVCLRTQTSSGEFREDPREKALIDQLFQAETQLASAHAVTISQENEASFIAGVRAFTQVIIKPDFGNSSIGLQEFALWIFQNGVIKWLKDISISSGVAKHDELWIVAAEAFNIMYSARIGTYLQLPPSLAERGVNRGNSLATDHLIFDFSKGFFYSRLQNTGRAQFKTDFLALADYFTKRIMSVSKEAGLIAKNSHDFNTLLVSSEAASYIHSEATAPDAATLINYFLTSAMFNNSRVSWAGITTGISSLPGVVLDRLYQKTSTTGTFKLLGSSRTSLTGDYTAASIYGALAQAFVTIIELSSKNRDATPKLAKMLPIMKKNKTSLQKYMKDRNDLKTIKTVTPVFTFPLNVGNQGNTPYANAASPTFAGVAPYAGPQRGYNQPQYGTQQGYGAQNPMMRGY